jgi:hypothetical protein
MSINTKRDGKPWNKQDVSRMRAHANQGLSARQSAARLGRTPAAVKFKAMSEGIRFHAIEQPKGVQRKLGRLRMRTGRMTVTLAAAA